MGGKYFYGGLSRKRRKEQGLEGMGKNGISGIGSGGDGKVWNGVRDEGE